MALQVELLETSFDMGVEFQACQMTIELMDYDEDDVSHYDCFHPSAEGQTQLAEETWEDGPFFVEP